MVPVRIRGGAYVEHLPDLSCPQSRPQPSPQFLLNVTRSALNLLFQMDGLTFLLSRMADMTLIKLQGQDGRIEPVSSVPLGRNRVDALAFALRNLVAVGATEMYAKMYANCTITNGWNDYVTLYYVTTRYVVFRHSRLQVLKFCVGHGSVMTPGVPWRSSHAR
jgi:hypothetical protein